MAATTLAIVVLIPGPLGRRLNGLRRRFDAEGLERIPAHIPLIGPFEARPSFLPLEQHCWQVCHQQAPFWVELGDLVVDESEELLYAEVTSGTDELVALREALLAGKYAPPRDEAPYAPRAVVAQPTRADDLALARRETAGGRIDASFYVERIDLMAQYPDGTWYERDFYTLDRAVTAV